MKLDILAFGIHPDDVELGCGGTIIAAIAEGKKVGIIDLTEGELGTRGTVATRYEEATNAGMVMGIHARENLRMEDGFFENNKENKLKVIETIRKYQPEIILCNAPEDRHPDHGRSATLVSEAAFLAGLHKIITSINGENQPAWRPKYVFHYVQDRYLEPNFLMDITNSFDKKMEAILCYTTQFTNKDTSQPKTYISNPQFMEAFKGRALLMGKRIGVQYAEGFITQKNIGISSFDALIQNVT